MEPKTIAQPDSARAGFPQAANHAFSPYGLAFDDYAEPRTIPANWDLSGLVDPVVLSKDGESRQASESPSSNHPDR